MCRVVVGIGYSAGAAIMELVISWVVFDGRMSW